LTNFQDGIVNEPEQGNKQKIKVPVFVSKLLFDKKEVVVKDRFIFTPLFVTIIDSTYLSSLLKKKENRKAGISLRLQTGDEPDHRPSSRQVRASSPPVNINPSEHR